MLRVLTQEEVIESREQLLDDLNEALLGPESDWKNGFPGNSELYNMVLKIFNFWKQMGGDK